MGEEPKHKITHVDVLVHPGYGALKLPLFSSRTLYESLQYYMSVIKTGQIDPKRFKKILFGVWGGRIKEIARQKEKGLVIVPLDFSIEGIQYKTLLENKKLKQASIRFIMFAEKEMGERLVIVNKLEYIEYEPERILKTYIKRGFMDEYTQPEFVVYGERSDQCVKDAKKGLDKIGRTKIDYSRTEKLEGLEKLKRKIVKRSNVRKKMPRRHGRWV